ncbi:putative proteasome subunit beta type-4, partial [Cucumispora dikerogammari]
ITIYNRKMDTFNKEMSLKEVANLVRKIVYSNIRKMQMDVQFVIFEADKNSSDLYLIDMYGCMSKSQTIALGLATYFCFGIFDNYYKYELNKEEGKELINKCSLVMKRSVVDMKDTCYVIDKETGEVEEY